MRLRTFSDSAARLLGAAGLILVLGAGGVEALRFAYPHAASAADLPAGSQDAPDATPAETATAESAPTAEPTATAVESAPTAEPTAEPAETVAPAEPTAAAESAPTAEPTAEPAETVAPAGPTATTVPPAPAQPVIGDAPLRLDKSASTQSVTPGQTFTYRIELMSARSGAAQLQDYVDAQLEVVSATVDGGSCSLANPVVCSTNVTQGQPSVAAITVRVRAGTAAGAQLVSQALVQDDQSFTASSGPVVVQVGAPEAAAEQSAARDALLQQAGTPTPIITEEEGDPIPSATPSLTPSAQAPAATQAPAGTATPIVSEEEGPATQPAATPVVVPTVSGPVQVPPGAAYPAPQTPVSPDAPIIRPPARPAQAVVPLPNTAATGPAAGVGFALLGFALILHGARRVRWEDRELTARVAAYPRLRAMVRAVARIQRAVADGTDDMDERVREIGERLDDRR